MASIICKILSVCIALGGVVISILEQSPIALCGFLIGGLIAIELAEIMSKLKK